MKIRALFAMLVCAGVSFADEGMWTFDNLPSAQMKAKYGWAPDQGWLDAVRLASVKFPGGSGAFVSRDGLVLTNHHIARGSIIRVSPKDRDLVKEGFTAASRDQEIKIPNYELRVLVSTLDVTDRVKAAAAPGMAPFDADKARKERLGQIQAEMAKADPGLSFEPVTLYQGGEYWMYGYKKFTDVRLVAAPELQAADFGGSQDNYTYPRWGLDFALLRVYENGESYRSDNFLPWTKGGLKAGDLVLVSGHPGSTFRQQTLAQMKFARDYTIPARMRFQERQKAAIQEYGKTGGAAARHARDAVWGIDNGYKRIFGQLQGLKNPDNMAKVAKEESVLKAAVAKSPALSKKTGGSWAQIEGAIKIHRQLLDQILMLDGRGSALLGYAVGLVRWAHDSSLPADKRKDITDESLKTRKDALARQQNIDDVGLDTVRLRAGLQEVLDVLGPQHDTAKMLLGLATPAQVLSFTLSSPKPAPVQGVRTPEQAATDLLAATKLNDEAVREQLIEGGNKAVEASKDPLVVLARAIEAKARPLRKQLDEEVTAVISEHSQRIAEARFAIQGKSLYPDATNTLRLTYGPIATYPANGTLMQPFTTFHGLIDRFEGWGGNQTAAEGELWTLPQRWLDRLPAVNLKTPYNFVYACDTVGGNSGSPVINAKGELVGLNFDSNMEGQAGYYVYDGSTKRSIAVDARAITEALSNVMDGKWIVDELMGATAPM